MRTDTDWPAGAASSGPSSVSTATTRARAPAGSATTSAPGRSSPPADAARVGAPSSSVAQHPLDREAQLAGLRPRAARASRGARAAAAPRTRRAARERSTTLSPCSALIGSAHTAPSPTCAAKQSKSATMRSKTSSDQSTRSILLTASTTCADAEQRRDRGVAAGLLDHALARVDQHDRHLGGRGAGDHVARVLLVPRRVGEDEAPPRGREVAVRDVDRDALLALGAQAVGQQRQVQVPVAVARVRHLGDVLELVGQDRLGVVEQPPDQRRLPVVHRAGRREPQRVDRLRSSRQPCGPPWRPRSARSSARVSPRSVMRVAAISATTSSSVVAREATAPVQLMSPTVR